MIERIFQLNRNHTDFKREVLAGLTTFLTMSYIIFVQPAILTTDFAGKPTGMDFGAVLLATCVISAFSCILMGLFTNYPIALAPGMGENFFFVSVIMALSSMGFVNPWQVALGIVFISGVVFFLLSVLRAREIIFNSISPSMRSGIAVGIGLFITFIGFQHGGLIVSKPGTMVGLTSNIASVDVLVFLFGLIVTAVLRTRNVKGDIIIGIISSALLAAILGKIKFSGVFGLPHIENSAVFKMDIGSALSMVCLPFIIVFVFMDMFDTLGTLMGVSETAGFIKENRLPKAGKVLIVDSLGTVAGSCFGTSTVTSYIESAAGVAAGGRTGLVAVTVGVFFLISLIFGPIIGIIGKYPPITAAALVIVGTMMMNNIKKIFWNDYSESIPAFLIIVGIPFCYSIADGLALGFIIYPIIKLLSGKGKKVSWLMYFMAVMLVLYFIFVRSNIG